MKRLSWLLLAVFCAALLPVQPISGSTAKAKACSCCHNAGMAEMPGCCPSAAALPTALDAEPSARMASLPTLRHVLPARLAPIGATVRMSAGVARTRFLASVKAAPPVGVPLFKAHGRFRI